jgi:hypothetical protein
MQPPQITSAKHSNNNDSITLTLRRHHLATSRQHSYINPTSLIRHEMATDWTTIGHVRNSTYRESTLLALNGKKTPAELHRQLPKISRQHLSRSLQELSRLRLVECLTPKTPRYRLYQRTTKGSQVAAGIRKLLDVK